MPSLRAGSASGGASSSSSGAPRISSSSDATASSGSASSRSRWGGLGGGARSAARPSTASTVASYSSATGASVESDASGLTAKRLQHLEPSSAANARRAGSGSAGSGSQNSSGGGSGSAAARIGKPFETLLASDETWVLSETAHVARDEQDRRRELDAAAARPASSGGSRGSGTSSSAARRIVAGMPAAPARSRWEEREELDDASPPASPRFSTASSSVAGAYRRAAAAAAANEAVPRLSTESTASSTTDATPTLQSTPRMKQASSSSGAGATLGTPAPPRPPRAVERSPSASTRNSVASGRRYATPPEGGASPAGSQTELPIHPLGGSPRSAASLRQQQQPAPQPPPSPTPQRPAPAARPRTDAVRPPPPPPKAEPPARSVAVTQSALEPRAASPAVPFPRSSSKSSDAQLEGKGLPSSPPNGSISLAQEVAMNSPDPSTDRSVSSGGTFFSQRMKKTSGFLRKLRGGDASGGGSSRDTASSSDSKAAGKPGRAAKLAPPNPQIRRQASHSSFMSDGGASVAASTHSVPGSSSPAMAGDQFNPRGAVEEPVPVIPSQWAQQKGPKSPARRKAKEQAVGLGLPPLPAPKDATRAGSTPVVGTSRAVQDGPQRSVTSGVPAAEDGAPVARTSSQTHVRKADSAAGGSNSSGSELRHTIRAWETEMDETLGQSAQDLDAKTHIAAPPPTWTPSPRLPSIEGLGPQRGRQRSFMEDEEERMRSSESYDTQDAASQDPTTPRVDGNMQQQQQQRIAPVTHRTWSGSTRSQPSSYGRTARDAPRSDPPVSSLPEAQRTSLPSLGDVSLDALGASTYEISRDSMASAGHSSVGHLSRAESASARSDRTFETAVDPGSMFLRRAESRASSAALTAASGPGTPSASNSMRTMPVELAPISVRRPSAASALGVAADQEEELDDSMDPEMSIRLVPRRPSLEEPPTPTDAVPPASAPRGAGHARDVSDLGPLPLPSAARRGSRASVSSAPTRTASPGLQPGRPQTSSELGSDMDDAGTEEKAKELAARCWSEDEGAVKKEKIAETLGGLGRMRQLARTHYMAHFDFTGLRIDSAFRKLCDKLFLRAETQQVDRILHAFSERFWACNPTSLYSSADVVHSLVFSLLLLNTDLHVADIADRMTRNQFVRNTLSAIVDQHGATARPSTAADDSQSSFSVRLDGAETKDTASASLAAPSSLRRRGSRAGSVASSHGASTPGPSSTNLVSSPMSAGPSGMARDRALRATSSSSDGAVRPHSRAWEVELEGLLKEIYAAVKSDQIRLPVGDAPEAVNALLAGSQRRMPKSGNTLSVGSDRVNALKRGSIRGIQGLLGSAGTMRSDENLSLTPSSVGSRSFGGDSSWLGGATPSSSALSSPASQMAPLTLGFANTLSHSIIKETHDEGDDNASLRSVPEIGDDELALMGSPWAKEGVLTRKHYWDGPQKRARDKNWTQLFVVVQKGQLSMFRFGDTSSSSTTVGRSSNAAVGGGNWLSNATALGTISLAHTLANALPPPGYNRARPHVFALTLANGAVFFFQAGHEELVQEWVSTCNYWAARQSREPLAGGVSNMEYGWNKVMPRTVYDDDDDDEGMTEELSVDSQAAASVRSGSAPGGPPDASIYAPSSARKMNLDTRSIRSGRSARSMRSRTQNAFRDWTDSPSLATPSSASVYSTPTARTGGPSSVLSSGGGAVHANERMYINDWRAPNPPTTASTLKEEEQLESVARHIVRIEAELEEHNTLRQPMLLLYSPRGANRARAEANWTSKSSHLLGELTKWNVYAESLRSAAKLRADKAAEREVEQALVRADREMSTVRQSEEGPPLPL